MVKTRCKAQEAYGFVAALRPIIDGKALGFLQQFEAEYPTYSLWLDRPRLASLGYAVTQEKLELLCTGKAALVARKSLLEEEDYAGPRATPAGTMIFQRFQPCEWDPDYTHNPYNYKGAGPPPPYPKSRPSASSIPLPPTRQPPPPPDYVPTSAAKKTPAPK